MFSDPSTIHTARRNISSIQMLLYDFQGELQNSANCIKVAHLSTGIEVVHLYTGRPVCTLRMGQGLHNGWPLPCWISAGLHADLTGDRIIEIATAIPRNPADEIQHSDESLACKGLVFAYEYNMQQVHIVLLMYRQMPSQQLQVFNISICEKEEYKSSLNSLYLRYSTLCVWM